MDMENVLQAGYGLNQEQDKKEYPDDDILFLDNVRDLPLVDGALRMDRLVSVVCYTGKLQVEINTMSHTIHVGQVLNCLPHDTICNAMLSPDFEGSILSLSPKVIMELFGESILWDYFFHWKENRIISLRHDSLRILRIFNDAFHTKTQMGQTAFRKEITCLIIKAIFYEMRENISTHKASNPRGLRHGDVLFKQFIGLLSSCIVKSRNVTWYAEQLCITPKHLSTVCKRVSGKTAFDWINEYVALDIRHLLKDSDKSIKEVVYLLKFPNVSFFGSYCRKHFGMTPMEYRKYLRTTASNNKNTGHHEQNNNK